MRAGHDQTGMRRPPLLAALLGAALLAGCGGQDAAQRTTAPPTDRIRIANFLFDPDPVTVRVGRRIAIVNADRTAHTLTEKGGARSFDSGTVEGSGRGSVTFPKVGTFTYYCEFHATMRGTVTVVA
ncbi:MAG: hypothetical protein QOJ35_2234 [Solirubrobacteraceae bacterium]|jgi:plastocyanin|nr:hypothetical protein [Solirubrobacteraceae bacterium]